MYPIYRFSINAQSVSPNREEAMSKIYDKENNQKFFRQIMEGKLTFLNADYDFIMSQPFNTTYSTLIEKSNDFGQTWEPYFNGKFMRTDCQIFEDDKKIVVSLDPLDDYTKVLAGMDKEYDLIKLTPVIQPLFLMKRPLIQIYIPGEDKVSSFIAGTFFEQDADVVTDRDALVTNYKFAFSTALKEVNITVTGSDVAASGLYTGRLTITDDYISGDLYPTESTGYIVKIILVRWDANFSKFSTFNMSLVRLSDSQERYGFSAVGTDTYDVGDYTMTPENGATGSALAEVFTFNIYSRYLLDVDKIYNLTTYDLPSDDIVADNKNYRKAIGYAINVAYLSVNFSDTPTEWGLSNNGKYFLPPGSIFGETYLPISKSSWRFTSLWFKFDDMDWATEEAGRKSYLLRDTHPISSVISVLLNQIAPGITHEPTPDYSEFLYSDFNPITFQKITFLITQKSNLLLSNYENAAQKVVITLKQLLDMLQQTMRLFWHIENGKFRIEHVSWYNNGGSYTGTPEIAIDLTALLNVRNGKTWGFKSSTYDFDKMDMPERYQFGWMDEVTPAFEGFPIEVLSEFVQPGKIEDVNVANFTTDVDYMLLNPGAISKDGFALFGAVQANAIKDNPIYFPLYTSGTGSDIVTTPYINLKEAMTGRPGILYTTITANDAGLVIPRYYDYDNNFLGFGGAGTAIVAGTNNYQFSDTIPLGAVKFAFGATSANPAFDVAIQLIVFEIAGSVELPFVARDISMIENKMQNGYMSWITLHPNYWVYDLPSDDVLINEEPGIVFGVERRKKQTVQFPLLDDIDPMKLIKTYIGDGQVEKIDINLQTRSAKIVLKHDTE